MTATTSYSTAAATSLKIALRKEFGNGTSKHGFNLQVKMEVPAGVNILFGRSGAGKSTLLDCVAGIAQPNSGVIELNCNGPIRTLFDSAQKIDLSSSRRRVGYVFQELALFPHMTVEENIEYGVTALPKAERDARIQRIAEAFHIEGIRTRLSDEISGGERQRVALARSVITEPQVLLLDEPLSALDAGTKMKILEDLRKWNAARNLPILYVTHSRGEALHVGETVFMLEQGRLIAHGKPQQVLAAVPDL